MPFRLFFVKTLRKIDYKNDVYFTFLVLVVIWMYLKLLNKAKNIDILKLPNYKYIQVFGFEFYRLLKMDHGWYVCTSAFSITVYVSGS